MIPLNLGESVEYLASQWRQWGTTMIKYKHGSDLNKLVAARTGGARRRAAMLSASAFTGTFALLMVSPQSALAQCATSSAPNVVDCNASFASTNTPVVNPNGPRVDRSYVFTLGGDVAATVEPGVTVVGNGLAVTTSVPGANINFNNEGSVQSSLTPSNLLFGGAGVVTLNGAGGTVTYTGNGSIIDNFVLPVCRLPKRCELRTLDLAGS